MSEMTEFERARVIADIVAGQAITLHTALVATKSTFSQVAPEYRRQFSQLKRKVDKAISKLRRVAERASSLGRELIDEPKFVIGIDPAHNSDETAIIIATVNRVGGKAIFTIDELRRAGQSHLERTNDGHRLQLRVVEAEGDERR